MKILIDLSSAQPQGAIKINGGGEYSFILLKELVRHSLNLHQIDVVLNEKLGDNLNLNRFAKENSIRILKYVDINHFSSIITENDYDELILPICYNKYDTLVVPDKIRIVSAVHDLCEIYYYGKTKVKYGRYPKLDHMNFIRRVKDHIKDQSRFRNCIAAHRKIFKLNNNQTMYTVSYYSKYSFLYYLGVESIENVQVYYPPEIHSDVDLSNSESVLLKYNLVEDKYFMLNACCRWAKNDSIVAFALDRLFSKEEYAEILKDYKVILLGTDKKYKEYITHHLKNIDRFIFDGFVNDETIEVLYKNAFMFVFPSVIEGFGQPPVEAMKYGTLIACSTAMSIPEVCGDAALYFDPYSIDSISMALLRGFDSTVSTEQRNKEKRRYKQIQDKRDRDMKSLIDMILENKSNGMIK